MNNTKPRRNNIKNTVRIEYITGSHGPIIGYLGNMASGALEKFFKELSVNEMGPAYAVKNMTFWPIRVGSIKRLPRRQIEIHSNVVGIKIDLENDALNFALNGFAAQGVDVKNLHIDTYYKLNIVPLASTLKHLSNAYNLHLKPGDNCPKSYLRENFKLGFKNTTNFGSVFNTEFEYYYNNIDAKYWINYRDIYDYDLLLNHLKNIAEMFNIPMNFTPEMFEVYDEFMQQLPYGIPSMECDRILQNIKDGNDVDIPDGLTIFHESYIEAKIELMHDNKIEMPFQDEWFRNTGQIIRYVNNELTKTKKDSIITT